MCVASRSLPCEVVQYEVKRTFINIPEPQMGSQRRTRSAPPAVRGGAQKPAAPQSSQTTLMERAPPGQAPKDLSAPAPAWKSLLLPELPEATQAAGLSKAVGQISFMHTKGNVESVHIVRGQKDKASYGFVNFTTHEAAAHCFQASQQQLLVLLDRGRPVAVKALWAKNGARRIRKAVRGQKAVR